MKKVILSMLMLLGIVASVKATDEIVASNITIPQGGSEKLTIQLNNPDTENYGGFQFELVLPAGISATSIVKAARLTAIDGYVLSINKTDENTETTTYKVLGYNSDRNNISGTSGDIAYITLRASATTAVTGSGDPLTGTLTNVTISTTDPTPKQTNAADKTFTITIDNPLPTVTLDENSTTAPTTTTDAVNVIVERTIKASKWSTICLPFDMSEEQVTEAFGTDVKLKKFNSWSFEGSTSAATSITLGFTTVKAIDKNTPYLIKVTSAISSFEVDGVVIAPANNPRKSVVFEGDDDYNARINGVYKAETPIPEYGLFLVDNNFWYSTGSTKIKAFRAYFTFGDVILDSYGKNDNARVMFSFDDETTGISNIERQTDDDDAIYTLGGQRVTTTGKGVYIKDGKKIMMK
jgi:hypothetical protein